MDELQAAVLRIKLKGLDCDNSNRRRLAKHYIDMINNDKIILPELPGVPDSHVWHLFVIKTKERSRLRQYLEERNIQTQIHYPIAPHRQKCYEKFAHLSLPIAEQLANEVLSLPISPVMTKHNIEEISRVINEW